MEKHRLPKSPSGSGMSSRENHNRPYLYGTYADSYSANDQIPTRDIHFDEQHLRTFDKKFLRTAADNPFSYGSSSALTTSDYGGSTFATNHENSLKGEYMTDPGCGMQPTQYNSAHNAGAGCHKPELKAYHCDGVARDAYGKNKAIPGAAKTEHEVNLEASSILDFALDRTLEDWYNRIKNIGSDVPLDKLAQMLLDTPDTSMKSKRNESHLNYTFEPLGYSIIDRDERSYRARNSKSKDVTIEGIEPSNVSWRISPEDSISLFESRVMDRSENRKTRGFSADEEENDNLSVLDRTADLMDRIKAFSSDVSACDMADMLLPPPNGKSTKERLANESSDLSNVPNISDINNLIKAGLSSEELINELLDCRKSYPRSPCRSSVAVSTQDGAKPTQTPAERCVASPRLRTSDVKSDTSQWQKEDKPEHDCAEKKADITSSSDDSFVPMSYSIIDQDEKSILKKYQMANDITLHGIENSNISWQLNPGDISLFKDHKSFSNNRSFLRPPGESSLAEEKPRQNSHLA